MCYPHGRLIVLLMTMLLSVGCKTQHSGPSPHPTGESTPPATHAALTSEPNVIAAPATAPPLPVLPPRPIPQWLSGGGKGSVSSHYGMVSSVESRATEAGVKVLAQGGNAVDAAVAVAYALAVTHPSAGNIGGGGFMLIKFVGKKTHALDFREKAPRATTQALFDKMIREKARGPLAAGVPGTVAGLELAHKRFGQLDREVVMAPAIRLAKEGHAIGERQGKVISWAWPYLAKDKTARTLFGRLRQGIVTGPKQQGDWLIQPQLAKTLKAIAERGAAGFYTGSSADAFVKAMQADGGIITTEDLKTMTATWQTPLQVTYHNASVEIAPPPSAGGVAVAEMLSMFQVLEDKPEFQGELQQLHLFAEIAKRAHADRRFHVVDPDSVEHYDAQARRRRYTNPQHWLSRFPIGKDTVTPASKLDPLYASAVRELENTTHFSVVDADGNAVSCTTTLSASFGSKYMVPGLGVFLNNSFAAFGTSGEDVPKPGRRMTSSMSPTLVSLQDYPILVLGSPGGDTIPNTVVQVLRNIVVDKLPLSTAIDEPRIHHGFVPDAIRYERSNPPSSQLLQGLKKLGYKLEAPRSHIGDANNIMIMGDVFYGYADPREGGLALGPEKPPQVPPPASRSPDSQ